MNKKIILGISILAVIILGLIVLTVTLFLDADKNVFLDNKDAVKTSVIQTIQEYYPAEYQYSNSERYKYADYYSNSPCDPKYPECFQYVKLEQTRLEPCPAPRPACPLCYPELKQIKGTGYNEALVQIKTAC